MPAQDTLLIRNIAWVGAAGSGKTALLDAVLSGAGALKAGAHARGTYLDTDPGARSSGHTLEPAMVAVTYGALRLNLIDTPGHADLQGRALGVLPAADTVAITVAADAPLHTTTRRLMLAAERRGMCRLLVVTRMDQARDKLEDVLRSLQEAFGKSCLPLNLPTADGAGVADCYFDPSTQPVAFSNVRDAHRHLVERLVELDAGLMERYLEQDEQLQPAQLHEALEQALREGQLLPVCFTSAATGAGIPELLNIIEHLTPNPLEGTPQPFFADPDGKPLSLRADRDAPVVALVCKILTDPYVGRLAVIRVHQGVLHCDSVLQAGDSGKPVRIGHLYRLKGRERSETGAVVTGDLCAIARVPELRCGVILHDARVQTELRTALPVLPVPMYALAVSPAKRGDETRLNDALATLAAEDPSLHVQLSPEAGETVLRGLGDMHLRIAMETLAERFQLALQTRTPRVAYHETVTTTATGQYRHRKQSGGAGQFAEVQLRVEPLARGTGIDIVTAVVGGTIPRQFIPAVYKGVRQGLKAGPVAGCPILDVRVTVFDGKHHPVDSKEIAFIIAAQRALSEALRAARPMILEPIAHLEVQAPATTVGDIATDLAGRRGRVNSTAAQPVAGHNSPPAVLIRAQVPLAEISDYTARLRTLSGGEAEFSVELSHYDVAPARIQQELASARQPATEPA